MSDRERVVDAVSRQLDFTLDLRFVRYGPTGTVHVVPPEDPTGEGTAITDGQSFAEAATHRASMMCGFKLHIVVHQYLETFADEDLCAACVKAMGDESWRAFEHPQPTDQTRGDE